MSLRRLVAETGIVLLFATQVVSADRVSFDFIPDALSAHDMSPDGRFIVGSTDFDGDGFADGTYLLDTSSNEMTTMPALGLLARAVSDDGTVILGDIPDPTGVGTTVAGRWTQATGWQSLGHLPNAGACPSRSNGFELSADGSVAVGLSWDGCNGRGFKWTRVAVGGTRTVSQWKEPSFRDFCRRIGYRRLRSRRGFANPCNLGRSDPERRAT